MFPDFDMRLSEGDHGILEIRINGVWGTVCRDHFGQAEAHVVCKSLGYKSVTIAFLRE